MILLTTLVFDNLILSPGFTMSTDAIDKTSFYTVLLQRFS